MYPQRLLNCRAWPSARSQRQPNRRRSTAIFVAQARRRSRK